MTPYYDYCDTYDAYDSGLSLDNSNKIKTFSCNVCKQSKFIVKKSVGDSVFKCEECIETLSQQSQGNQETTWRWFSFF
jgi:transposase-like protein